MHRTAHGRAWVLLRLWGVRDFTQLEMDSGVVDSVEPSPWKGRSSEMSKVVSLNDGHSEHFRLKPCHQQLKTRIRCLRKELSMAAWALGTAGHDNHAAARVVATLGEVCKEFWDSGLQVIQAHARAIG